jgi:hypothetical protein
MNRILVVTVFLLAGCSQQEMPQAEVDAPTPALSAAVIPPEPAVDPAALRKTQLELCKGFSELAGAIMKGRQEGVSMAKAMEISESETTQQIIVLAYERPRMQTEENKARYVDDFGNDVYLQCVKEFRALE